MERPIVKINDGKLQGLERVTSVGKKFFSFKGIPYAEPPIGDLRFKAPVPIQSWTGIKDASIEGNKSPQLNTMTDFSVQGEEDCLFLNVYTPNLPSENDIKYPVMVVIHGGGFRMGSGNEDEFNPELIIEKEIVIVTVNYRLGIFGFLCLDTPEVPGNAGLKDQHLALKWVKNNIKCFSGDENNITIFGPSAGGASVEYHLLYPKTKGLITNAMALSGSVLCSWALNRNPKDFIKKVAKILKIDDDNPNQFLLKLNDFGVKDLLSAAVEATDLETKKRGDLFGFGPVIEKKFENVEGFLTEEPYELLKSGRFLRIPTISSICRDEGSMFTFFYDKHTEKMLERKYTDYMSHLNVKDNKVANTELTRVYSETGESEKKQLHMFLSDLMFASPISKSLKLRTEVNDNNYFYVFSYVGALSEGFSVFGLEMSGETQHATDVLYLSKLKDFGHLESKMNDRDNNVRSWIVALLTNFVKHGISTPPESSLPIDWKPVRKDDFEILDINEELRLIEFPWGSRMKVWDTFYE